MLKFDLTRLVIEAKPLSDRVKGHGYHRPGFQSSLALEFGRYAQSFAHLSLAQKFTED